MVAEHQWPKPQLCTRARRASQGEVVGCARWPGRTPATPPGRRPGPAEAPSVTGLVAQRRQRPCRRITPNTNTSTTTDDQHPQPCRHGGLLGRRRATQADATAAHPGKQLGHGQATSRARIDGRATRGLAGTPAPRDLPADLGWPGGVPDRPGRRPRAGPSGAEPFGPRPASPAATVSTSSTTRDEDSAGQPTRRDHSEPDRRDLARPRSVCPAWVGEQSKHGGDETQWPTPRRRRRTDGARLWRHPNLRRGRLHRPALPVQPRSALRDPPRMGSAEGNSAAATPLLSCRGPMVSSTRWPLQRGHPWRF